MIERPRSGEAQGAGLHGLLGDGRHGRDIRRVGRLPIGAALAHDEHAERRVRQLAADIHIEGPAFQGVQIVGIALPVPGQALGEHREGDVLHPLHQPDQPVVVFRPAGREADAAIAHHHGGHPVPGRGLHVSVPGGLAVIVGVDVHEAGGDQLAPRIDLLRAAAPHLAHLDDPPGLHRHVGLDGGTAGPVHHASPAEDEVEARQRLSHGGLPNVFLIYGTADLVKGVVGAPWGGGWTFPRNISRMWRKTVGRYPND